MFKKLELLQPQPIIKGEIQNHNN